MINASKYGKNHQNYPNARLSVYHGARHVFPRKKDVTRAVEDVAAFINGYDKTAMAFVGENT